MNITLKIIFVLGIAAVLHASTSRIPTVELQRALESKDTAVQRIGCAQLFSRVKEIVNYGSTDAIDLLASKGPVDQNKFCQVAASLAIYAKGSELDQPTLDTITSIVFVGQSVPSSEQKRLEDSFSILRGKQSALASLKAPSPLADDDLEEGEIREEEGSTVAPLLPRVSLPNFSISTFVVPVVPRQAPFEEGTEIDSESGKDRRPAASKKVKYDELSSPPLSRRRKPTRWGPALEPAVVEIRKQLLLAPFSFSPTAESAISAIYDSSTTALSPSHYRSGRPRKPSRWDELPPSSLPLTHAVPLHDNAAPLFDEYGNIAIPRKRKGPISGMVSRIVGGDIPPPPPPMALTGGASPHSSAALNSSTEYDPNYVDEASDDETPHKPKQATAARRVLKKKKSRVVESDNDDGEDEVTVTAVAPRFQAVFDDSEDDDDDSDDEDAPEYLEQGKKKKRFEETARYVKKGSSYEEIAEKFDVNVKSAQIYVYSAKKHGPLSPEECKHFDRREDRKYSQEAAKLIKEQKPIRDIYKFIKGKGASWPDKLSPTQKKARLNRMIYKLIQKGLLNKEDHQYLKADNTVLKKNWEMKEYILKFLEAQKRNPPTQDLKVLHEAFVQSDCYPENARPITHGTFTEHLTNMRHNGRLSGDTLKYVEACKDQEQARRSRGGV